MKSFVRWRVLVHFFILSLQAARADQGASAVARLLGDHSSDGHDTHVTTTPLSHGHATTVHDTHSEVHATTAPSTDSHHDAGGAHAVSDDHTHTAEDEVPHEHAMHATSDAHSSEASDHGDHSDGDHGHDEDDGHGDESGHGDEDHHSGHEHSHEYDASFALLLYGGLAFGLFVKVGGMISSFAWSFIASVMSIFIAVSFWSSIARLFYDFCNWVGTDEEDILETVIFFIAFITMLFFVSILICLLQWSYWAVITTLSIGSHFTGFGLYYFIGTFQVFLTYAFGANADRWAMWGACTIGFIIGSLIGAVCLVIWAEILHFSVHPHVKSLLGLVGGVEEGEEVEEDEMEASEHFKEQLIDFTIEAFALGSANGLIRCFTVMITATPPSIHHRPPATTQVERSWMLMVALLFVFAYIATALVHWGVERYNKKEDGEGYKHFKLHIVIEAIQVYLAFCAAWALLEWSLWWLYTWFNPHEVEGHVVLALIVSAIASLLAVLCGLLLTCGHCLTGEESFLRSLVRVVGLFAGLTWELVFDVALINVENDAGLGDWFSTLISWSLILFMLPAYVYFVFPKSVVDSYDKRQGQRVQEHVKEEATTFERIVGILKDDDEEEQLQPDVETS
eukprot:CAMPEP_0178462508 /NCGR_PEP_ID=MMETSP0689_2-20121128/49859_1 /TAXON_ID=160604 /ORGANISM="Amphidinium massartii, Strain CS-259" /LENGTH=621 /DNA_ID=CAMNT_0020089373 /DNA_START=26 /DNA_END=1892 /DNA_ORIENTATION=-